MKKLIIFAGLFLIGFFITNNLFAFGNNPNANAYFWDDVNHTWVKSNADSNGSLEMSITSTTIFLIDSDKKLVVNIGSTTIFAIDLDKRIYVNLSSYTISDFDIRDLVFSNDKVDVSSSNIYASSPTFACTVYQPSSWQVTIDSTNHSILVYLSTHSAEVRSYQGADWSVSVIGLRDLVSQSTPTVYQGGGNWGVNTPQVQGQFSASTPTVYPGGTFPVSPNNSTVAVGSGTVQSFANSNFQNKYRVTVNSTTWTTIFSAGTISYGEYALLQNTNSSYNMLTSSSTDVGGEFGFIPPLGSKIWDEMNIPCNIKMVDGSADTLLYGEECSK